MLNLSNMVLFEERKHHKRERESEIKKMCPTISPYISFKNENKIYVAKLYI